MEARSPRRLRLVPVPLRSAPSSSDAAAPSEAAETGCSRTGCSSCSCFFSSGGGLETTLKPMGFFSSPGASPSFLPPFLRITFVFLASGSPVGSSCTGSALASEAVATTCSVRTGSSTAASGTSAFFLTTFFFVTFFLVAFFLVAFFLATFFLPSACFLSAPKNSSTSPSGRVCIWLRTARPFDLRYSTSSIAPMSSSFASSNIFLGINLRRPTSV